MQTPNSVHTTDNRATVLDSLENNIGHSLPKGRAASTAGIAPDADSRTRRVRHAHPRGGRGGRRYKALFVGKETDFSGFKLDLSEQDRFFQRIYAAARQVGWGCTTTYGALAKGLGAGPEAARDVGQAMAKNPVALIIPCHRVLGAGGKIGGFSASGGSAAKVRMLALEGVHVGPAPPAQQSFGF